MLSNRKEKEPEQAIKAYERCLAHIKLFKNLQTDYKKFSGEEKKSLQAACLKGALMQLICLIGDSLTWLRDKEHYGMDTPLYKLANEFSKKTLRDVIYLRNLYPHDFLYKTILEEQQKAFDELFDLNRMNALNTIQNKMQEQINSSKVTSDLMFTGDIKKGATKAYSISSCWLAALKELYFLEKIDKNIADLSGLSEETISLAQHGCIKNICQAYQDYLKQFELKGHPVHVAAKTKIDAAKDLEKEQAGTEETEKVWTLLKDTDKLRQSLAHPNMPQLEETKKEFLDNYDAIQKAWEILWRKGHSKKIDDIVSYESYPENFIENNNFYFTAYELPSSVTLKERLIKKRIYPDTSDPPLNPQSATFTPSLSLRKNSSHQLVRQSKKEGLPSREEPSKLKGLVDYDSDREEKKTTSPQEELQSSEQEKKKRGPLL